MKQSIIYEVPSTPCFDVITHFYGVVESAVFGKLYMYSRKNKGVADVARKRIAEELNISEKTVYRAMNILKAEQLITDLTPQFRRRTHLYRVELDQLIVLYNTISNIKIN